MASYELFAREVIPHFQGQLSAPFQSHEWAKHKRDELFGRAGAAIMNAIQTHVAEQQDEAGSGNGAATAAQGEAGSGDRAATAAQDDGGAVAATETSSGTGAGS